LSDEYVFKLSIFGFPFDDIFDFLQDESIMINTGSCLGTYFALLQTNTTKLHIWYMDYAPRFVWILPTYLKGSKAVVFIFEKNFFQEHHRIIIMWLQMIKANTNFFIIVAIYDDNENSNQIELFSNILNILNVAYSNSFHFTRNIDLLFVIKRSQFRDIFKYIAHFLEANDFPSMYLDQTNIYNNLIGMTHSIAEVGNRIIYDIDVTSLNEEEKEIWKKFLRFYSTCPICGKHNHENYLESFFLSSSPVKLKIKKFLIDYMEYKEELDEYFSANLKIGIPCCSCFNKYFNEK